MSDEALQTFAPLHILVIDDDPMIVEILSEHYTDLGFTVDTASDGQSGLAAMEARLPDVVICDRKMPGLSGASVLEQVRSRGPEWQKPLFFRCLFVRNLLNHDAAE